MILYIMYKRVGGLTIIACVVYLFHLITQIEELDYSSLMEKLTSILHSITPCIFVVS